MIKIALVGEIGSGKTFISKLFRYPVFSADEEVVKIYSKNKKIFYKLKEKLPRFFFKFPIKKKELINAILENSNNIKKISSIVHPEVRKNLLTFFKNNKNRKIVILDIPLYLENKLNKKKDIIIFIQSNKSKVYKKIKERKNFNKLIYKKLKRLQFSTRYKRKKSHYVIKNDFNKNSARKKVRDILNNILR
ncbi:dephospho-CoA kinase [Candidatus Pelagibacter communis]|uniref:dephospho-CoA kinase n=1 Tax=Pelagibacter ubique TaxID=198252 RepID=UPI00094C2CF8|nr:dephospho-CoA kinase [Candidatus Pelagibacter ubique]